MDVVPFSHMEKLRPLQNLNPSSRILYPMYQSSLTAEKWDENKYYVEFCKGSDLQCVQIKFLQKICKVLRPAKSYRGKEVVE